MKKKSTVNLTACANRINLQAVLPKLTPQARQIGGHLLEAGSISGIEAAALFRTRSLTRRISDLRARGIEIESERKVDTTGQRYVRYVLA